MHRHTGIHVLVITVISLIVFNAGCALLPKTSLSDIDIPATDGTTYTAYQSESGNEAIPVSFSSEGPWDFTKGPTSATIKSVMVKKTGAAGYKSFGDAAIAEKVLATAHTNNYTIYNFTAVTPAALYSYGQSSTPGPGGPIIKVLDRPERLLKFPVRVGDEWTDTITATEREKVRIELKRKVIARGQVKVPAGSFFNCFMIRLIKTSRIEGEGQPTRMVMYFWWAPGVGLVAAVGSEQDETQMFFKKADYVFRLKSYDIK